MTGKLVLTYHQRCLTAYAQLLHIAYAGASQVVYLLTHGASVNRSRKLGLHLAWVFILLTCNLISKMTTFSVLADEHASHHVDAEFKFRRGYRDKTHAKPLMIITHLIIAFESS